MKVKLLEEIADLSIGYTFRQSVSRREKGDIPIVQMKDLDGSTIDGSQVDRTFFKRVSQSHCLQGEDLLFQTRGACTWATRVKSPVKDLMFSAPLVRIRIKEPQKVLPSYVQLMINHQKSQNYFRRCAEGSLGLMISYRVLRNLSLHIPHIKYQKELSRLYHLMNKECRVLKQIISKKQEFYQEVIKQYIGEDK